VGDSADGASDCDNGEYRGGGNQHIAQGVARHRGQQQRLAGEPGRGNRQRDGERRDHHRVQADQQSGNRIGNPERRTDIG
jgi:hypothetical protein